MPPSDYRPVFESTGWVDGFAVFAAPVLIWGRALWSRIRNRGPESVEGHKVLGPK